MKRTKAVSLLLSLSLLASLAIPGTLALPVRAVGEQESNGMVISKTAKVEDGTYTISLEAYATGSKVITETKKDIPTDIVLVLDQSGSMDDPIGEVSFEPYQDRYGNNEDNSYHYENRHNGGDANLYYPIGDGAYASVSVTVEQELSYSEIEKGRNNDTGSWNNRYTNYWNNQYSLYALLNGEYVKVTLTRSQNNWWSAYTYTYTLPNGTVIATNTGDNESPTFTGTDDNVLYLGSADQAKNVYTYTYTDADGAIQTIGTSTGANTVFETTLYEKVVNTNRGVSRLNALKNALNSFTAAVNAKAAGADNQLGTADDINHRIAVVGYASRADSQNPWVNTEVFVGANQYNYSSNASNYYDSAFQSMNTAVGQTNVAASIGALAAEGATYTNYGLEMANGILSANPVASGEKRNRVIVLFTDGYPGSNANNFNTQAADDAFAQAQIAKNSGTSVYAVGIFAGADATSVGDYDGNNTQAANYFMQNVSSNNGSPKNPSYYLSASDAETLNSIFQQISDNIETGGSSTTLNEETVIKDIIAPEFALPDGADASSITLETYSYTGENQWAANHDNMGAAASVNGDKVDVTGFDFAEHYVGTVTENGNVTYRGDKLVITFTVHTKDGFLGGNNVYTNTNAGVYENGNATEPILTFERPQVNVPIPDVTVTAEDKNVYLLNGLTAEELRSGATATVGNVELDLTKPDQNYGLEDWQTSGVDISVVITDADGNEVSTDLTALREDTTYKVEVRVSPKEEALSTSDGDEAAEQSGNAEAAINVFKPELTYKDGEVYYGDTVPTDFTENLTATKWKHNDVEADTTTMGEAPELALTYTPDETRIKDGKINTKQDVSVDAEVKIGTTVVTTDTTFLHTDCTGTDCSWNETTLDGTPAFLLHVQTCQLTISKTGGASDEPYVFTVFKDGVEYSEITIVGNTKETIYELPVGTYTIKEDTGWSWRYNAADAASANLTAENPTGNISCHNTKNENYWLNGFSDVVKNIFGNNK